MEGERSPVRAELDRLGATIRKTGAWDYISATLRSDGVKLTGPPREHPRRSWLGPEWQLLELLARCRTTLVCRRCGGLWALSESRW